jgi:hypothetical protein
MEAQALKHSRTATSVLEDKQHLKQKELQQEYKATTML